jgi:hypothetical protein
VLRNSEGSDPSNFETSDAIACRSLLRAAALFLAYEVGGPGGAGGPAPGGAAGGGEVLQPGLDRHLGGAFILRKWSIFGLLFFLVVCPVILLVVQFDAPHECTAMDWTCGYGEFDGVRRTHTPLRLQCHSLFQKGPQNALLPVVNNEVGVESSKQNFKITLFQTYHEQSNKNPRHNKCGRFRNSCKT